MADKNASHLLLIYPDFLGDFLLFFPFIQAYAPWFEQRFQRVTWLCHPGIMPLVDAYQAMLPANFNVVACDFQQTSLSIKGLLKWPWRRKQVLSFLSQHGLPSDYQEIWCPSFMPWLANGVLKAANSPRKLSRPVQDYGYNRLQQWLNTELYQPENFDLFVAYQHHQFFLQAFQQNLPLPAPIEPQRAIAQSQALSVYNKPYMVMVPDSAAVSKEWPAEHFADLIALVLRHTELDVVILGVRSSVREALQALLPPTSRIQMLMGQTTPLDLLAWVDQAQTVVCNDSFALHAAAACHTPVLCLTNGSYRGRYWPYPDDWTDTTNHYYLVTPPGVSNMKALSVSAVWHRLAILLYPSGYFSEQIQTC